MYKVDSSISSSSSSSYVVTLSVVHRLSLSSSLIIFIKYVVCTVGCDVVTANFSVTIEDAACGCLVPAVVTGVPGMLGFVMGLLFRGALGVAACAVVVVVVVVGAAVVVVVVAVVVGFRVANRVGSTIRTAEVVGFIDVLGVVWAMVEDAGKTLGIKIHSGGCSVFTVT